MTARATSVARSRATGSWSPAGPARTSASTLSAANPSPQGNVGGRSLVCLHCHRLRPSRTTRRRGPATTVARLRPRVRRTSPVHAGRPRRPRRHVHLWSPHRLRHRRSSPTGHRTHRASTPPAPGALTASGRATRGTRSCRPGCRTARRPPQRSARPTTAPQHQQPLITGQHGQQFGHYRGRVCPEDYRRRRVSPAWCARGRRAPGTAPRTSTPTSGEGGDEPVGPPGWAVDAELPSVHETRRFSPTSKRPVGPTAPATVPLPGC